MEILRNFGFDPVMLTAQIVNFLIILFLLKRFLYKPVLDMLKKRVEAIREGIKQAEEARITLEKTLEQEKKILSTAQENAKQIMEDAKVQALEIAREIEANARAQSERMVLEAKQQINQEALETERKLSEKVSIIASSMLTKSLAGMFGEKEQKEIASKALRQIKKIN